MAGQGKTWFDVTLPKGVIMKNWQLAVGVGMSIFVTIGLYLTQPEPPPPPDPMTGLTPTRDANPGTTGNPDRLVSDVDRAARRAAAEQARAQREEEQVRLRERAMAENRDRENREELRRAREQLERFRARQLAGEDPRFEPLVTGNSEEAVLREALILENITRDAEAMRSSMIVTSARQFPGGRSHALVQHAPQSYRRPQNPVPGGPPGAAPPGSYAPPPLPAPVPPVVTTDRSFPQTPAPPGPLDVIPPAPPAPGGAAAVPPPGGPAPPGAVPGAVGGGSAVQAGAGGGLLGPPLGRPGRGPAGTFDVGRRADGAGSQATEVVITPNDGIDYRLYEGTLMPAVLQTQIHGDFTGPISAQITRSVYSRDRQRILVPRGTVFLGTATGADGPFQERLAIGFHRMILPDGRWILLAGNSTMWGLSALGESSLRDQVNRHYLAAFGGAGAIGLLAALSQNRGGGGGQGAGFGFQDALSQNAAQVALQLMSRFLNRRPTVTIRAGHRLHVRMMSDVIVPAPVARPLD